MKKYFYTLIIFTGTFILNAGAITPKDLIPSSVTTCKGVAVTLSIDTNKVLPFHWIWNTGETTASITVTPSSSAKYIITVSDGLNSYSDTTLVIVNQPPSLTLSLPDSVMNQCAFSGIYKRRIYSGFKKTANIIYGSNLTQADTVQTLLLDLYEPNVSVDYLRPLIIFAHGGGFTAGTKSVVNQTVFADSMTRKGYVVACIDYRMGMDTPLTKSRFEVALYRVVQDMNTAIRFFREKGNEYSIDTSQIFTGGTSVGAEAALYSAFMDQNEIPLSIDTSLLGGVNNTGGHRGYSCRSSGILNCWGNVLDSNLFKNNHYPPFNSFQTVSDQVVPYTSGLYLNTFTMYGCYTINRKALQAGIESYLSPFSLTYSHGVTPGTGPSGIGWDSLIRCCTRFLYNHLSDKFVTKACFKVQASGSGTSYSWLPVKGLNNTTGSAIIVTPSSSQTYTVTASANGCSSSKKFSLTVNPKVKVVLTPSTAVICFGKETTLSAGGGKSYSWEPAVGNSYSSGSTVTTSPTSTTIYTVTGFDVNGCTGISTAKITVNPLPVPSFSGLDGKYCHSSSDVTLNGNPSGGIFSGEGVKGNIFSPSVIDSFGKSIPLTYQYTDSNSCSADTSYSTIVYQNPQVNFSGVNEQYCRTSAEMNLHGNPEGGIFSGEGMQDSIFIPAYVIHINQPVTISYFYSDSNNCSNTDSVTTIVYSNPVVKLSGLNEQYCQTAPKVLLTGSPFSGSFKGDGVSNSVFSPNSVSVHNNPITVYYSYTDSNSCSATDSATTIVYTNPVVSLSGLSNEYCQFSPEIELTGNPSMGFFSGEGINGSRFSPPAVTSRDRLISITYTYTDTHNCTDSASAKTIVHTSPVLLASSNKTSICMGDSVTLQASGLNTISWNSADSTLKTSGHSILFSPKQSTTVFASGKDGNKCPSTDSVTISVHSYPVISVSPSDTFVCPGSEVSLTVSDADSYTWFPDISLNQTSGSSVLSSSFSSVAYTVIGKNIFGCADTSSAAIRINNNTSINILKVFPNPSGGKFNILTEQTCIDEPVDVTVINIIGQEVWNGTAKMQDKMTIDLTGNGNGIYFIIFKSSTERQYRKIVLE